jgi:hypothetical protein
MGLRPRPTATLVITERERDAMQRLASHWCNDGPDLGVEQDQLEDLVRRFDRAAR